MYIVHCTLYIVQCTLYIVQCTMYNCTLYIVHHAVNILKNIPFNLYYLKSLHSYI